MQRLDTANNGNITRNRIPATIASRLPGSGPVHRSRDAQFAFSANDTKKFGVPLFMPVATYALALGTTPTEVVRRLVHLLLAELGRIPTVFNYFSIDAAAPPPEIDVTHYHQMGVDGSGTVPMQGYNLFNRPDRYQQLRRVLNIHIQGMATPDPELATMNPREAINVCVFVGPGGTGGGCTHSAITLLHDVFQDRSIQDPRIHLIMIGPDMPLRDWSRSVIEEQRLVVPDTIANNLDKACGDMVISEFIQENRPDGTSFPLRACDRIYSITLVDQSNGEVEFSTTDALIGMLARTFFFRMFTLAGKYLMDRERDHRALGVTGRPTE